jgi:putative flippase GtrA
MSSLGLIGNFRHQAIRFGIVGLASNILLYVLYLLLTAMGVGHKAAMTMVFAAGTVQTFVINKRWTFDHQGLLRSSFVKYVSTYISAYLLNLTMLWLFVDRLGYPHQIIQGVMIFVIALILFFLQRYWVFRVSGQSNSQ